MSVSGLQIVGSVLVTSCLDKLIRCYDLVVSYFILTLVSRNGTGRDGRELPTGVCAEYD